MLVGSGQRSPYATSASCSSNVACQHRQKSVADPYGELNDLLPIFQGTE
ncbi:hypothetical protein EPYR_02446 [Erwinia pyrifoliae DSM 12163]|nr:hypothetical protein EPYR_02446 [Erwinia pyrifoliae DSM 12163]